jgi:hypothetical protein
MRIVYCEVFSQPYISSMQCACAIQYFYTLSHKRHDLRQKVFEGKMCVLIFSTVFVWNIALSKKNWARYDQKCIRLHVKYPLFLSDFNETRIFSTGFRKNTQISNFMKIRHVEAEFFHADGSTGGQTERRISMTKIIVTFRNFVNAPKTFYSCRLVLLQVCPHPVS